MKKLAVLIGLALVLSLTVTAVVSRATRASERMGPSTPRSPGPSPQALTTPASRAGRKDGDPILLQADTIDTSRQPSLDQVGIQSGLSVMGLGSGDDAYYLVQFRGPIQEDWRAAVIEVGGTLFGFVPEHALIVKMDLATAEKTATLPNVQWIGLYQPRYKVAPRLAAEAHAASQPIAVTMTTFEPSAVQHVVSVIRELGGRTVDWRSGPRWGVIRAEVDPTTLDDIAGLVDVSWIEPFVAPQIANNAARHPEAMNVDVVHQTHGLTGAGQIIAQADTGLDLGAQATIHPDFAGSIKAAYAWGRLTLADFDSPGSSPRGLAWDGTHLWNIDHITDRLYQLSPTGDVITSCEPNVGGYYEGLTWDGSAFWSVDWMDDTLYRLDGACNILDTIPAPGNFSHGLAWDGTHLWVSDVGTDTIYQLDASGTVLQSFPAPGPGPQSLLWLDGYLWCGDHDAIFKLDPLGTLVDVLSPPGTRTSGLAWDGSNLWVSARDIDLIAKMALEPTQHGDWGDPDGHGTHAAGSIVGDGSASAGDYAGTAPDAELVHQSIMDPSGGLRGLPVDLGDLFAQAYSEGARIHSDSWGANVGGAYTVDSAAADAFMWDHDDMLLVFSAGNAAADANSDGIVDADSMGAPATAKNVLTVGASENRRPTIADMWYMWGFPANPIRDDAVADNVSGMAAFSSRGPTDDGRVKPDVVAPGTSIVSTRSRAWPFYDDFEGGSIAQARAEAAGLQTREAAAPQCRPLSLDARGVVPPDDAAVDVPTIACVDPPTQERDGFRTQPAVSAATNGGDWTATGDWTLTTDDYHSPSHAWFTDYGNASRLTANSMDVRTGGDAIGFWTRYDVGEDALRVEFTDDGRYWIGYTIRGTQSDWAYRVYQIPWGYCWLTEPIPGHYLERCFDQKQTFRFRFAVESSWGGSGYWYVDDVKVFNPGWGSLSDAGLTGSGSDLDEHYLFNGGTSMATPLTSGAAALVRQFYSDTHHTAPSAALVKATLINGATDMTPGQYGVGSTGSPVFSDTMESSGANWAADPPWALTTSKAHSADHSWTDSPGGDYGLSADTSLTSVGTFDLTTISDPGLVFWHQYDIETGFDYGFVEVSTDGGASWTPELAFTGTKPEWIRSVVDLSAYAAETAVKVRFRLQSDTVIVRDGWYVDDVSIRPISSQEIGSRPDSSQGWGRVNLAHALFPSHPRRMAHSDVRHGLLTGQTRRMRLNVTDSYEPLRLTLVWTDYPSSAAAAINLVNNLDLRLIGPDATVYYANGLDAPDVLNNVEDIQVASPSPGTYTVEVVGTEVVEGPQPYALVMSGAMEVQESIPSIEKLVTPESEVNCGDELTYTLVISAASGTQVGLYDPLSDITFERFVEQPPGVTHSDGTIAGTLSIGPTNQATVAFVAQVNVSLTEGQTVSVTNRACVYPVGGTVVDDCTWSDTVTNRAFRPCTVYLPMVMRND